MPVIQAKNPSDNYVDLRCDADGNLIVSDADPGVTIGPLSEIWLASTFAVDPEVCETYPNSRTLRLITSVDGINWTMVKRSGSYHDSSNARLLRDPSIIRYNGVWYVAHTVSDYSATIGLLQSTDLITWTFVQDITVAVTGKTIDFCWAPELCEVNGLLYCFLMAYYDAGQHIVRIDCQDLDPSIAWSASSVILVKDPSNNTLTEVIDPYLCRLNGDYILWVRKGVDPSTILYGAAASIDGPFLCPAGVSGDWAGWGDSLEGPSLVRLPTGIWRIYFDDFATFAGTYYSQTNEPDDFSPASGWTAKALCPGFTRHGSALRCYDSRMPEIINAVNQPGNSIPTERTFTWADAEAEFAEPVDIDPRTQNLVNLVGNNTGASIRDYILLTSGAQTDQILTLKITQPALAKFHVHNASSGGTNLTNKGTPPGVTKVYLATYRYGGSAWTQDTLALVE